MREILFRAKCDNELWLEGIAFPHDRDKVTMFSQHPIDGSLVGIEVIPETVGQYTGLKDKNGKKIFEGDIIEFYGDKIGAVVYNEEDTEYGMVLDGTNYCGLGHYYSSWNLEVIGNIHDNPELLER